MENLENEVCKEKDEQIELKRIISNNLTELRKEHKLTQAELALKFNYSDKAISKWERGEAIPDVLTLSDLARFYGVTLDYFVNENPKEKNKYKTNKTRKRLIITLLSALTPWLLACIVFIIINLTTQNVYWMSFLWAIPLCSIILIVFNGIWGNKLFKFILVLVLIWSLITSIYLELILHNYNIWLLFILGIPSTLAIILWGLLEKNK